MRTGLLLAAALLATGCLGFHKGAMAGEPPDDRYLEVLGTRVRYQDLGPKEAPAVVLVHGFASSLETWGAVAPQLLSTHRVLALDLKGFGWTDRPEGDYSVQAQAALIAALMDSRGIQRASLVGHSYGASVVLTFALSYPERVERLALYDAFAYDEQLPSTFHLARARGLGELIFGLFYGERTDEKLSLAFYDKRFITEDLVEDVQFAQTRPGTNAAALAVVRGQVFTELEKQYRTVKAPTLLLWGREDTVTPLAIGERLLRELPRAQLKVYPRCGHFPMIEAAAASTRELVDFLAVQR